MTNTTSSATTPRAVKRVGILTFHRALNYGAVLQAYALQQAIARLSPDLDVKIVDYRCPAIEWTRVQGLAGSGQGLVRSTLLRWVHYPFMLHKLHVFDAFLRDHLALTAAVTKDALDSAASSFECLVSGSDQVWNPGITHGDSAFFLDFAPSVRRVAYAASFGSVSQGEDSQLWLRRQLTHMDRISVREMSAASIVEALTGVSPRVVLDPTLLLTRAEWMAIAKRPRGASGRRYILIYNMVPTDHLIGFARALARATGCRLRLIGHGLRHIGIPRERMASPAEFIGLFENAAYVIANSFHGVSFAINFERPFFTEMVDATGKINTRVQNLLDICGLRDRALKDGRFTGDLNAPADIDWTRVRARLDAEREHSLGYLRTAIGV